MNPSQLTRMPNPPLQSDSFVCLCATALDFAGWVPSFHWLYAALASEFLWRVISENDNMELI